MKLTSSEATNYMGRKLAANATLNPVDVASLLNQTNGATVASVVQVTPQPLAKFWEKQGKKFFKVTRASILLFNNLRAFTDSYVNAVKRTAGRLSDNDQKRVEGFKSSGNYFVHTSTYSITKHKTYDNYYLFTIYNPNATPASLYIDGETGQVVSKSHVAQFCTNSVKEKMLNPNPVTHNKRNDVMHTVQVRNVKLENIVELTANGQTLSV